MWKSGLTSLCQIRRCVLLLVFLWLLAEISSVRAQWIEPAEVFRNIEVNPALTHSSLTVVDGEIYFAIMRIVRREPTHQIVGPDEIYVGYWHSRQRLRIVNVSESSGFSTSPAILSHRQQIHLLWGERKYNSSASPHEAYDPIKLMYARVDGGEWTKPRVVYQADSTYYAGMDTTLVLSFYLPVAAALDTDGDMHVLIHDYAIGNVYLNRTKGQWSQPQKISDGFSTDIAVGREGTVYTTFVDSKPPRKGIRDINSLFFMKSTDGGGTWSEPVRVSLSGTKPAGFPQTLIAPNGRIHIIWQKFPNKNTAAGAPQLWHSFSDNQGETWSKPHIIDIPGKRTTLAHEAVIDRFGRVHVIFGARNGFGDPNGLLYETVWSCGRWSLPSRVLGLDTLTIGHSLAIDNEGNLHLVWQERVPPGPGEEFGDYNDYYSRRPIGPEGCWHPPGSVPESGIILQQNYPNPAVDLTTIYYALAEPDEVTLAVYDMLGRLVMRMHLGPEPAGRGSVPFDTSGLAAGVYFYTLTSGNISETRKMLVIR